ncbi:TetR family transcriptional regulator [Sphingomonas sp. MAH-20]|uniref:TetR family transcriptional regulator n=1 Tax=Sphingomonas horti TaxID=2682842 RepID=A0A6I4J273_9SPHN|nr:MULTISPECIES: TetR/AcrR family transcriptional regulator [Sphingomonas]MBA2920582.1 TetR/AcrR family transcriptional regulator [Sphingomonas sp. CGMCC 1.13658]MVO78173.1 TetR family transcriptional regulator [Sphingomonas horti]
MDEIQPSLQRRAAARDAQRLGKRSRQHQPAAPVSRSRTSKKAQQSQETRDRLLDAAEELFARHGLYGVTVRNVAQHAEVDTALIHYYFGTKRGMFDAVFDRRTQGVNQTRMAAMDAYEAASAGNITVEGAIRAFLQPILEKDRNADQGWRNYSALVAMANNSKEWGGEMMSRLFDHVIRRLIALLKKAMPDASDEDLYWSYQMLSGSLMVIQASTGRIELLSGGLCRSDDVDAFGERLVQYAAAGFRAVCASRRR